MSVTRIASRYAKSLIDLAVEQKKLDRIKEDVDSFQKVVEVRDFYLLLKSPIIKPDKKLAIFEKIFLGKYDVLTMEFLKILLRKGREQYLPEVAKEFLVQYRQIKGISVVKVTTAKPLSEHAIESIRQKLLDSVATKDHIEISTKVDPLLVGGFVIEFGDRLYDASIKHKLEKLKAEFKDNAYISQIMSI